MKQYSDLKTSERDRRIKSYLENGDSNKLLKKQLTTLKEFYEEMISQSRSEETVSSYLHKLKKFGEFIKKPYEDITENDFKKFIVHLNNNKAKLNYINGFKIVLRVFYKYLLKLKDNNDPLLCPLKVKRAGPVKTPSDCLDQEEIKSLINATENYRDRFLIHGLYESALRKSEYMNLKIKDIELYSNFAEIKSVNGKTGFRKMKIPLITSFPDLVSMLNHHPYREDPESPLFVNIDHPDRGLGPYGLNDSLLKYKKKISLNKGVYPHIFRHSRLTHLGEQGFTEMELRLFAGWTDSSPMASHYVHSRGKAVQNKILSKNGIETESNEKDKIIQKKLEPVHCLRCGLINSAGSKYCRDCGAIIDLRTAFKLQEATDFSSNVIQKTYEKKGSISKELMKEVLKEMIKVGDI